MPRDDYQERLEAKRDACGRRADKLTEEAARRFRVSQQIRDGIPLGQPILIGHHSEGRHRRDIKRMRTNLNKGYEAQEQAQALAQKAETLGTGAISSDDPEAVTKLKKERDDLIRQRDSMKIINGLYRKGGWDMVAKVQSMTPETIEKYKAAMSSWDNQPFPAYRLTNTGANIRRIEARIKQLTAEATRETMPMIRGTLADGNEWQIEDRRDLNRIVLTFDRKPPIEILNLLTGWLWAPSLRAHVRMNNAQGRYHAQELAKRLQ